MQLNRTGENQVSGQFRLTPDGRSVVFTNGTAFVYATRLDGSRPALALND